MPKTVLHTYAHSIKQQELTAIDVFDTIVNYEDENQKVDDFGYFSGELGKFNSLNKRHT